MAVSKLWRGIAGGTPALWARLSIKDPGSTVTDVCVGAQEWLSHARNLPLSLSLSLKDTEDELLRRILLPNLARVQTLTLSMPFHYYAVFNKLSRHAAPLLEIVDFTSSCSFSREFMLAARPTIEASLFPSVRSVTLGTNNRRAGLLRRGAIHNIPWSMLTTVDLREPELSVAEVQELVLQCPRVVSCSVMLSGMRPRETSLLLHPPTTLRDLQTLRLVRKCLYIVGRARDDTRLTDFLQPFVLPALRTLEIASERKMDREMSVECLVDLQHRSSFELVELRLSGFRFHLGTLVQSLQATPTITTLHLEAYVRHGRTELPLQPLLNLLTYRDPPPP